MSMRRAATPRGPRAAAITAMIVSAHFFLLLLPTMVIADSADLVVIEKAARQLTLLHGDQVLARYRVALGRSPIGAKRCQGDKKTPEGDYRISGRNAGSAYYRSLRISYPNKADHQRAAALGCVPGGDIMIHGLPNGQGWIGDFHRTADWTDGCIAVTNEEIDHIWSLVANGTRVRIKP